jgi:hypothetical protein
MPSIICLDEPTSGLDSENALEVIRVLSKLAANGHTVICTIHQPRVEVYHLFTKVLVLTKFGILYHGSPAEATQYLENCTGFFDKALNPADSLLMLASKHSSMLSMESLTSFKSAEMDDFSSVDAIEPALVDGEDSQKTLFTICEISESESIISSTKSVIELHLDKADSFSSVSNNGTIRKSNEILDALASNLSASSLDNGVKVIGGPILTYPDNETSAKNTQLEISTVEKYFSEIITLNSRWWNVRPISRKMMMLIICIFTAIVVGIIHRRPGDDIVSFELQMKGLLLGIIS